jgi:hypothetical protein
MFLIPTARRLTAAIAMAAFVAGASSAVAQTVSDTHLKAAREAIAALKATEQYDIILPSAAAALKNELIQKDPNLEDLINTTVDEKALEFASRRGDLEREAALAYARSFSEDDLKAIAAFYTSEPGKALLNNGSNIIREVAQAAEIWQRGLARDLAQAVGAAIQAKVAAQPAPAPAQ